ncbi:MAG: T9SS type A sorting domain-containing protein [Chitinophagaceae bacterium]|nr:T9SS type A sorting domain-containing protein [Chitinophagaceae bacterium]
MKTNSLKSKILLIAFILMATFSSKAQNILLNSSFNSGSTNWNYNGNLVEINPVSAYGSSGSNAVAEIDVEVGLSQRVAITKGASYQFTFKGSRRTSSGTPSSVAMRIRVTGATSGTYYVNTTKAYTNTSFSFATQSYSFNIPSSSTDSYVVVSMVAYNNTGTLGVIVDDVQLINTSATTSLPVVFGTFSATAQNNKVTINFITEQEINNDRFEIERSSNGVDFTTVATLKGTNTSVTHQYNVVDVPSTTGTFQYRIHQIDVDGKSTYSKIVAVRMLTSSENFKVFPTVATTQVNIALSLTETNTISIMILDVQGRIYMQQQQVIGNGSNQQSINVSSLSKGMYYIQIKSNDGSIKMTQAFQKA